MSHKKDPMIELVKKLPKTDQILFIVTYIMMIVLTLLGMAIFAGMIPFTLREPITAESMVMGAGLWLTAYMLAWMAGHGFDGKLKAIRVKQGLRNWQYEDLDELEERIRKLEEKE